MFGRRLVTLLIALAAVGVPAGVLQATCAGRSCDSAPTGTSKVPFCGLPEQLRRAIANGYREDRSPHVLGVARELPITSTVVGGEIHAAWPSLRTPTDDRVPIVLAGAGVANSAILPTGVTLDRIAPTVSEIIGLRRRHPDVRSGTAVDGVATGSEPRPRLVVLVAWKGVGAAELETADGEWPFLASLLEDGAGTLAGRTGSLPLDPAATLTTMGTGGLPSQHGITGSVIRNDLGEVVAAFGERAPVQVISTVADDLEESTQGRALVGLVATDERDRGIVGGAWYEDQDPVDVVIGDGDAVPLAVDVHLSTGYGADAIPDVIGVVMDGAIRSMDTRTAAIVRAARRSTGGSALVVVAGAGSREGGSRILDRVLVRAVEDAMPGGERVVAATVPGGLFLDQDVLADTGVTGQVAVDALLSSAGPGGKSMIADAFQGFAVSFARYC